MSVFSTHTHTYTRTHKFYDKHDSRGWAILCGICASILFAFIFAELVQLDVFVFSKRLHDAYFVGLTNELHHDRKYLCRDISFSITIEIVDGQKKIEKRDEAHDLSNE